MQLDARHARLDLAKNEIARLTQAHSTRLDCLDGVAWITVDGDPRDVVLTRGQSFVIDRMSDVLVCAIQGHAAIDVHPPVPGMQ